MASASSTFRRSQKHYLLWTCLCLLLAAALRIWIIDIHPPWDAVFSDMGGYVANADRVFTRRLTVESFFQPIGFSALLASLRALGSSYRMIATVHVFASVLTVYLAGRIAAHLAGERAALFTTFVLALHFPLAYFVGFYMAETLYAFVLVLASWIVVATRLQSTLSAIAFGVALSLGYWLKGFTLPIVVFSLMYMGWAFLRASSRRQRWQWVRTAAIVGAIFALQPIAHHEITRTEVHEAQWGPTASGLNLVEGKCPWKRNEDSRGYGWWSPLYVQQNKGKYRKWDHRFTDAAYFRQQGIDCIKQNPSVLLYSLIHVPELFIRNTLWPAVADGRIRGFNQSYELFFIGFAVPGLALGFGALAASARARRNLFVLAILIPLAALCVTVYVFKSEVRFRIPFDPLVCVIACCGWATFASYVFAALRRVWLRARAA